jgi:hypothetical protein
MSPPELKRTAKSVLANPESRARLDRPCAKIEVRFLAGRVRLMAERRRFILHSDARLRLAIGARSVAPLPLSGPVIPMSPFHLLKSRSESSDYCSGKKRADIPNIHSQRPNPRAKACVSRGAFRPLIRGPTFSSDLRPTRGKWPTARAKRTAP